jgi:hypothetical protein
MLVGIRALQVSEADNFMWDPQQFITLQVFTALLFLSNDVD